MPHACAGSQVSRPSVTKPGHTEPWRAQQDREGQTTLIGMALGVFAVVMAVELLCFWLADVQVGGALLGYAVVLAGACAVVALVRSERH